MTESSMPLWWIDIQRAWGNALLNFETVLDSFETVLLESHGINSNSAEFGSDRWISLERALSAAVEGVERSSRLAESRRRDVAVMGLTPPEDFELKARSSQLSGRSKQLYRKIQSRMNSIEKDLSSRTPRPPGLNLYRSNTPSYIDVRV